MRKEALIAIIGGILIGLLFTFGIIRINKAVNDTAIETSEKSPTSNKTEEITDSFADTSKITLLRPIENQVFGKDIITLSGKAMSGSYIAVTGGTYDNLSQSDNDGNFTLEYEIEPSVNVISIHSIDKTNKRLKTSFSAVFTSEFPENEVIENAEKKENGTDVESRLYEAQNIYVFLKGTVTDLTDGGLQIKTENGEIKQITLSDTTTYAKTDKSTVKITLADVAIGDYILALGKNENNGLLGAFRIIVTKPMEYAEVKLFYGKVIKKGKTNMLVEEKDPTPITIEIDNNTKTYKGELINPEKVRFANVSENDQVIGTYQTVKDENIARRIYIIETGDGENK